jgi:hypothetical protein
MNNGLISFNQKEKGKLPGGKKRLDSLGMIWQKGAS